MINKKEIEFKTNLRSSLLADLNNASWQALRAKIVPVRTGHFPQLCMCSRLGESLMHLIRRTIGSRHVVHLEDHQ